MQHRMGQGVTTVRVGGAFTFDACSATRATWYLTWVAQQQGDKLLLNAEKVATESRTSPGIRLQHLPVALQRGKRILATFDAQSRHVPPRQYDFDT